MSSRLRAALAAAVFLTAGTCAPVVPEVPADLAPTASAGATELATFRPRELSVRFSAQELELILRQSPLGAPPPDPTNRVADDPCAAQFGQWLFFDTRLSSNGGIACATCHDFTKGTGNGTAAGHGLGTTARHVPVLWNLAWNRWFFWDGRADSAWAQAMGPMEHPDEHGYSRVDLVRLISQDAQLRPAYEAIFGELPDFSDPARFAPGARPEPLKPWLPHHLAWIGMTLADRDAVERAASDAAKAIAAYERLLVSRRSPFDVFVEGLREREGGKVAALDPAAQRGLRAFVGKGRCLLCHHGPNFTDGEFHDARLRRKHPTIFDEGRWNGIQALKASTWNTVGRLSDDTQGEWRWKVEALNRSPTAHEAFKTPTLRNVATSAPYFHDGSFGTLDQVIEHYSTLAKAPPLAAERESILQPVHFTPAEMQDLHAFLEALTSTPLPAELMQAPASPLEADCLVQQAQ